MKSDLPRGIRNNNPGNIRHGESWQGLANDQPDPDFATFMAPEWGLRAVMRLLINYHRKHNVRTVGGIISRWAPPNENDTVGYINAVSKALGVQGDTPINWWDGGTDDTLIALTKAIARHENGRPPAGWPTDWFDHSVYVEAARLARA